MFIITESNLMQINKVFDSTWDMPIFDKRNDFLETSTATMDYVTEKLIFEKNTNFTCKSFENSVEFQISITFKSLSWSSHL